MTSLRTDVTTAPFGKDVVREKCDDAVVPDFDVRSTVVVFGCDLAWFTVTNCPLADDR
jgi:hypothetical protein